MMDSFLVEEDLAVMKKMGLNCIRIGFDATLFESMFLIFCILDSHNEDLTHNLGLIAEPAKFDIGIVLKLNQFD